MLHSNSHPTVIIAEMSCSHEGRPDLAKRIIDAAGCAEADAIQFQMWILREMVTPDHPDYKLLTRLEMAQAAWADLASYSRSKFPFLKIIACIYEVHTLPFAEKINVDAYKIHSADLSNPSLIRAAASTGKPIHLCVGASTITEIQTALQWIKNESAPEITLMYGYQNFPTRPDDVHLRYMMKLRELFELPIGYQDHADAETDAAFWIPAAAIGCGVDLIEKHLTHDRSQKGTDHEAALNPDEFGRFVRMVRVLDQAMGQGAPKPFSKDELNYRRIAKKSIVTAHPLPAGTVIRETDLRYLRAAELGLPPDQNQRLLGRRTHCLLPAFQILREDHLK